MVAPVVIVGSGLAGWTVARELRKLDAAVPIVLVTASPGHFYAKPTLSNALALARTPAQIVTTPAEQMATASGVTLLAETTVTGLDAVAHTLSLSDGQTLAYRDLVLANGAQPIVLPMAGNAAQRVYRVNHLEDYAGFHAALGEAPKRVLVIGAGLIGCEFANDLVTGGHQVSVVDPAPRPLASLLPPEAGAGLQTALAEAGVVWRFGTSVVSLDQTDSGSLLATLADGQAIEADLVLSAVGLRADVRLAQAAGAVCERGIVVDERLGTTLPGVWALGDNAQYPGGAHPALRDADHGGGQGAGGEPRRTARDAGVPGDAGGDQDAGVARAGGATAVGAGRCLAGRRGAALGVSGCGGLLARVRPGRRAAQPAGRLDGVAGGLMPMGPRMAGCCRPNCPPSSTNPPGAAP